MSESTPIQPAAAGETRPLMPSATPAELEGLMRAFNEATDRLQATHVALTAEVGRLKRELARANDELERSRRLAAIGEMAAGIAHEVRNPLGSITLYATMLEEDLGSMPDQQTTARKIRGAVRGLDAIVTDVLHFSREVRATELETVAGAVFARVIDATRDRLAGVDVCVDSACEDLEIVCDPDLVHRALVNLVRNAADAMAGSDVRRLRLSARTDASGECVRLTVGDTGPGIASEVRERMFNPFFTTRAAGTGLGLSIVHRIAEAHGGRVEVRNRAGNGSDVGGASISLVLRSGGVHQERAREAGAEPLTESHGSVKNHLAKSHDLATSHQEDAA